MVETPPAPTRRPVPKPRPFKECGLDYDQFMELDIPPVQFLLDPVLMEGGMHMIYAPAGAGKTLFAMNQAWAVATGGEFLGWKAARPRKVVYIDGELPLAILKKYMNGLPRSPLAGNFRMFAHALMGEVPNLSTFEGRRDVEQILDGAELLVMDNLMSLFRTGRENDEEAWVVAAQWLRDLRRRGVASLLVHHSGKSGDQRGTSKRIDNMDLVTKLRRPPGYSADKGLLVEYDFGDKPRIVHGERAKARKVKYEADWDTGANGRWTVVGSATDPETAKIVEMRKNGAKWEQIAAELGIPKTTAQRRYAAALAAAEGDKW